MRKNIKTYKKKNKLIGGSKSFFPLSVMKPYVKKAIKSAKRYMHYNTSNSENSSNNSNINDFAIGNIHPDNPIVNINAQLEPPNNILPVVNAQLKPPNNILPVINAQLDSPGLNNVFRKNMNNEFLIYLVEEYEKNLDRKATNKEKKYLFDEYIRNLLI